MTDTLAADINREGLHTLEAPAAFETDGSFDLRLRNHGESTHVHLHLDDDLSEVARLEAGNHYVQTESERRVRVSVADPDKWPEGGVHGKLKIVTAYGASTHFVDVTLDAGTDDPVEVSPDLSKPQPKESSGSILDSDAAVGAAPGIALVVVGVLLAAGAATPGTDGTTAVVLAALAVISGLLGAGYLLLR